MVVIGGKLYLSAREISRMKPFDSKLVAALNCESKNPILADYSPRTVKGEKLYAVSDWMKARRRYMQRTLGINS